MGATELFYFPFEDIGGFSFSTYYYLKNLPFKMTFSLET